LLGAYVSGTKRVVTQRESAFVLLAGPLPGILLGSALYVGIEQGVVPRTIYDFNIMTCVIFLVVLNGINLLPIYPLDGGQLLNRVFLDEEGWVSKGFVLLSAVLLAYMAIHYHILPLLIFPFLLLFRLWRSATDRKIERRIEDEGIETELDYDALPDVDYWRIRHILIEENASIRSLAAEHVDTYSPSETQIQQAVEAQLHRTLVQDLSVSAKVLIGLIWMSGLLVPLYLWLR
jgi:stage IV sporulation protein FB